MYLSVFTARNEVGARLCFYTCLWFCTQGGDLGLCPQGVSNLGGLCAGGVSVWGVSVWGISVQGVSVLGGLSPGGLCLEGGLCPGWDLCHGDAPYGNERAVCILLECILVFVYFCWHCSAFSCFRYWTWKSSGNMYLFIPVLLCAFRYYYNHVFDHCLNRWTQIRLSSCCIHLI